MAVLARLLCLLLFAILLGSVGVAGPPRPAHAQSTVEFSQVSASADFPSSLTFEMESRVSGEIDSVQVFWKAAGADVTSTANADYTATDTLRASHTVDTAIQYIPPGIDIVYFWSISTSDGAVHNSDEQSFFYMDDRFDWDSRQAGLVTVWWYQGSDEYADEIAHSANGTVLELEADYGLQATEPIRIFVYASDSDFSSALRANSAEWIGGVAYSSLNIILANIPPGGGVQREIQRMVPHEVAHVVVSQSSDNPYNSPPPWLDEGLATFIQTVDDPRLAPVLDRATREGRLIPVGALRSSFPADPDQALLSYAESRSIVAYLAETYGRATVGDLVTIYQQEVSHDEAIARVLGLTMEQLDANWKAWLGYEGDQVEDPYIAASESEEPGTIWFLAGLGIAAVFAGGMVAYFFWRTRSYKDSDDGDEATDAVV